MLKYNLCLIKQGTKILLLNREKPTWLGCWNGVGGKLEPGESARVSMIREIGEETGIDSFELTFKGLITWSDADATYFGGLYLYLADLPMDYVFETPIKTDEGILDWKEIEWILHPENLGVASNIPPCLQKILYDSKCYNHHSVFHGNRMVEQVSTLVDAKIEHDELYRNTYLQQYAKERMDTLKKESLEGLLG